MEYLESGESIKEQLREKAARRKEEFQEEARSLSTRAEKALTNGLIIAGALAVTYWVFTSIRSGKKKSKKRKQTATAVSGTAASVDYSGEEDASASNGSPGMLAGVGNVLLTQASLFLLDIAKDKLREYLVQKKQEQPDENS
jgi:hypothetical protein